MNKIHIALVGGQPVPVYIGIKDEQTDKIILICSDDTLEEANRIQAQCKGKSVLIKKCKPTDLDDISSCAGKLKNELEGCDITINLTSGTKLWALTFYQTFVGLPNVKIIYINQTNDIINIKSRESHKGKIDPFVRLALYGARLSSWNRLSDYTSADFEVMKKIQRIRKLNTLDFAELTSMKDCDDKETPRITKNGSSLVFSYANKKAEIKMFSLSKRYQKAISLQSEHLADILFNTAWFELKVAKEICQNKNVKNVWLNCTFPYAKGNPKNEIDIIAELPDRLLFVECKTKIFDNTDLDKFKSAVYNFSGTSSNMIFVTLERPSRNRKGHFDNAMEKCKDNGIATFNFALWQDNPVGLPSLSKIVDSLLFNQNK
jgi:hypothetical protein